MDFHSPHPSAANAPEVTARLWVPTPEDSETGGASARSVRPNYFLE